MNEYKKILDKIRGREDNLYFVHYSCESLSDENESYSPRVTSIAVLHHKSAQMFSFSMHLSAEKLKIKREEILNHYEEIELKMLQTFIDFVNDRNDRAIWIHWNMSNINYGFEAIEHRYFVLCGEKCIHISEDNKYNLSSLIKEKYGHKYAKDPKLYNLMLLNGGVHRDFLNGEEEARAFKAKEFVKLHKSTMSKVYFFQNVFVRLCNNNLRTDKNSLRYRINKISQNPLIQLIGVIGVFGTIISLIMQLFQ